MPRPALLWLSAALVAAGIAPVASAQIHPITVPRGKLRWDFFGRFESYHSRWNDGSRETAAIDFFRESLDRTFVPGLADAEARLERITGLTDVELSLGSSRASELVNLGALGIGAAVGLTSRITVFGMVPLVRVKVEPRFVLDTTAANAGVNPADPLLGTAGAAQVFIAQLDAAIATLDTKLNVDGAYDADPALKALAEATLARAREIRLDLVPLLETANFFPREGSAAAVALIQAIASLQNTLATSLDVTGFTELPPLPSSAIDAAVLDRFLTDPTGPIAARPLDEVPETIAVGDVEVGAAVTLLDRFPSSTLGSGARSALRATVRLPTARLASSDRFFELGTGDRQPDLEVDWVTDLTGGRLGARLAVGYNLQLAGSRAQRVTPPEQPIAPVSTLADLRRDPGDLLRLTARPFLRLAPYFMLYAGADYWRRGADRWTYPDGQAPVAGADLDALGRGSRSNGLLLSGGISFSHSGLDKYGRTRLPLDASVRYERILRSGTGILPDASVVRFDLRFYSRLWGS